jgi:hypothetical protein
MASILDDIRFFIGCELASVVIAAVVGSLLRFAAFSKRFGTPCPNLVKQICRSGRAQVSASERNTMKEPMVDIRIV